IETMECAVSELKLMKEAGIKLVEDSGIGDDYAEFETYDSKLAEQFGLSEDEFEDELYDCEDWIAVELKDEDKQMALISEVEEKLYEIASKDENDTIWEEYHRLVPNIIKSYGITNHVEEIADQIWDICLDEIDEELDGDDFDDEDDDD